MSSQRTRSRKAPSLLEQLAHTGDGVFAVDRYHRIIQWNLAAKSLLGYSDQEVLGKYCHNVIQGRDSNGVLICNKECPRFEAARSLRRLSNKNLCARSKRDADVWINVTTLSVFSQRGRLSTLVHFFRKVDDNTGHPVREKQLAGLEANSVPGSASQAESRQPMDERISQSVPLTKRERSILRHLTEGLSTKAIGERLYISPITVKNHVQNILKKLQVHSRIEAIALAFHRGLV